MLEIYALVLSIFFIGLSIRFFHNLRANGKYVKSLYGIIQNFVLIFCIVFLINLLSLAIIRNIEDSRVSNPHIQGIASNVENHDINYPTEE
ncbi:MAG: hypothetical protein LBQ34_05195 [Alphaproteobacteria bacterium]|jgi:hypothetical protein|nr:hypothetical protein [Alphaproteobacteria bacterium]